MAAGRSTDRIVELVIATCVVVISVVSLFLVVRQTSVMERQLEASVRPYVQIDTGNYDPDSDTAVLTLTLANPGLGPARIERFSAFFEGREAAWPSALIAECCADGDSPEERLNSLFAMIESDDATFITDAAGDTILEAGTDATVFAFFRPEADTSARAMWERLDRARFDTLEIEVCYCSMFDECWTTRLQSRRPEPVRSCALD